MNAQLLNLNWTNEMNIQSINQSINLTQLTTRNGNSVEVWEYHQKVSSEGKTWQNGQNEEGCTPEGAVQRMYTHVCT